MTYDPYLKDERVLRIYEVGYGEHVRTREEAAYYALALWRSTYRAAIAAFNKRLEQAEEREISYIRPYLFTKPEKSTGGFTRRALDMQGRGWPARSISQLDFGFDSTLARDKDQNWYAGKLVGLKDSAEALYWTEQLGLTDLLAWHLEVRAKAAAHEAEVQAIIDASPPPGERKR